MNNSDIQRKGTSPKKLLISVGSIIILVLAAISFVFIPAMVQSGGTEIPPFGYYNKKPIEYKPGTYFTNLVQMYSDREDSDNIQNSTFNIFNSAFTEAVLNIAFTQAVDATRYVPPTGLVDRNMLPYFYDENGVYSKKIFSETSESIKIELRDFIENGLVYRRYIEDIFGSTTEKIGDYEMYGLKTPSAEEPFIQAMGKEQRTFNVISFPMDNYPAEEAALWAQNNSELFTSYDLSVISLADETAANNLLKQLQNNEILFEDAITELSQNYYSGTDGKLTNKYRYQISNIVNDEAALEAITSLTAGSLSEVISTVNGFSIFRGDSEPVIADLTKDEVLDAVINYMQSNEAGVIETYYLDLAQDFWNAASVSGLTAACREFDVEPARVGPFPLNYKDSPLFASMTTTEASLSGASSNENFMKTAFGMQMDEISSPMVLNNQVILLQLVEETSIDTEESPITFDDYTLQFDQTTVQNAIMTSDKLQNDFFTVFFQYFMNVE